MSERLQQGGEVVEIDLLQVVSHCVNQAALSVSASHVLAWLRGVDYSSNTCAPRRQNDIWGLEQKPPLCVFFFMFQCVTQEKNYQIHPAVKEFQRCDLVEDSRYFLS